MSKKYNYLIVGAGLYGATFAYEAKKRGLNCLIIDKRDHIGGNVFTKKVEDINIHWYGAHIFHTSNKEVWDFVNSIVPFNRFTNSPLATIGGKLYNLPFNMNTFHQLWGVKTPDEAKNIIEQQTKIHFSENPSNLEEQALNLVGQDIYEKLIKGYTEKQWGRSAKEIPAFIIKRLPLRFTYDNNYFNDLYQGIPIGGYSLLVERMLEGIEVRLGIDFFKDKNELMNLADRVVYTGKIDEFFDYQYGELEYRSLRFEHEILDMPNFQGNAVVNYTDANIPYTRIIEHKHFEFGNQAKTMITKEYSQDGKGNEPYYPINDAHNNNLFARYMILANELRNVIFGGRLAEYKYYDMHNVIEAAWSKFNQIEGVR